MPIDVSIACTGDWQIRNRPKRIPDGSQRRGQERKTNGQTIDWPRMSDGMNSRTTGLTMLRRCLLRTTFKFSAIGTIPIRSLFSCPTASRLESELAEKDSAISSSTTRTFGKLPSRMKLRLRSKSLATLPTCRLVLTFQVPPTDAPIVCVIDSGIQESHLYLEPAIRDAESRCFLDGASPTDVTDYVKPSGHGTRVAGVVLYGENVPKSGVVELDCWIQNARVLDAHCKMPLTMLPAAMIRDVISHFNRGNTPTRIFNHSINSTVASRTRHMSSWAAEIDQLCHDRDILVLQSVGNIRHSNPVPNPGVAEQLAAGKTYPDYLSEPASRIANPAQSLQALTSDRLPTIPSAPADGRVLPGKTANPPHSVVVVMESGTP